MKRALSLLLLFLLRWSEPATPDLIHVRLFSIEQPSQLDLELNDGKPLHLDARTISEFRASAPVIIRYRGRALRVPYPLVVSARDGKLRILAELPEEDYVAAVLAGEAAGFESEESLKAMAVAARTYARHFAHRHDNEGFDFCDSTHCQDFRVSAVDDRVSAAARATRGEVLVYDDQPIPAYYHQDCGGVTEPMAPYLSQIRDAFCAAGRKMWSTELSAADLHELFGIAAVRHLEIIEKTSSGRARLLRIEGSEVRTIDAESFRLAVGRRLGWDRIRSDLYSVRSSNGRFRFEGYGAGHGIGLCQAGAAAMGKQGHGYREILAYYYPNTSIRVYQP